MIMKWVLPKYRWDKSIFKYTKNKKLYTRTNKLIKNKLNKLPVVGNKLVRIIQRFKRACKQLVIRGMYFEDIGFTYLGPVDGHNIEN